jgi:hypothetical protein
LNPKRPPKTQISPIWAKFGFQVDFHLANWYPSSFLELGAMLWSFRSYHILLLLLLFFLSSPKDCPTHFSEMSWSNFMKPCRNIICHVKLCL